MSLANFEFSDVLKKGSMMTNHTIAAIFLILFLLIGCTDSTQPVSSELAPVEQTATDVPTPTVMVTKTAQDTETAVQPAATRISADTPESGRQLLTFENLMDGFEATSPVQETAFAPPENAAPPETLFEGRLELIGEEQFGDIEIIRGDPGEDLKVRHLPQFDFAFVQNDGYLIPAQRGLIITDHPTWNYIIEPGRVWQEAGDQGYTRASFPFTLVPKGENSTFNGTMMFLFNETSISKVWYQITQETSYYPSANLWGLLEADYHPQTLAAADQLRADFTQELANRFPTKPIEQLAVDYPGTDITQFGADLSREHLTTYGLVIDGVNYVSECFTRYGPYTYCDSMRAPSWSTAKSAFASIALMRLAQQYDPGVPDLLIKDYLPETMDSPGDWSQVTFDDALDMATGNFGSSQDMADEDQFFSHPFWTEETYAGKMAGALSWPHGAEPGTTWVYHTSDTFIVTSAMNNYLQTQAGADADIFDFVVDEVYRPIKMGPGVFSTARTNENNWQGQPFGGYGLWWVPDDIAKIATLLQNNGRSPDGEQILHPDLVAAALQNNPDDRGVLTTDGSQYNNAFWATRYDQRDGYDCEFWVPQMQGFSGIVVVPMLNGSTYYYFSDNQEFTWETAVRESNK
ncbi:MAG: hypothetical protein IAF02_00195, partial [Anaerolineae bacterium]|nr:hypothetical protein [Anaerolineae bacterium]